MNKSKQFKNKLQLTSLSDLVGGRKRKRREHDWKQLTSNILSKMFMW
jgi:hypothetical protein